MGFRRFVVRTVYSQSPIRRGTVRTHSFFLSRYADSRFPFLSRAISSLQRSASASQAGRPTFYLCEVDLQAAWGAVGGGAWEGRRRGGMLHFACMRMHHCIHELMHTVL